MSNLSVKIEQLSTSPTFNMSLGEKELFHSNFWAWLINIDKEYAKVFLGDNAEIDDEGFGIEREHKHHDLTIINKNKIYLIENKIKSLPSKEQLDRYKKDIVLYLVNEAKNRKNEKEMLMNTAFRIYETIQELFGEDTPKEFKLFAEKNGNIPENGTPFYGVLTGLPQSAPIFIKASGWTYLSYAKISERIKKLTNNNSKINGFEKQLILTYCDDIATLSEIFEDILKDTKEKYSFKDAFELKKIRFIDVYKKFKMDDFARTLDLSCFKIDNRSVFEQPLVDYSPNGKANLTIRHDKIYNEKKYSLGIQIEEYQFRFFVEAPNLANDVSHGDRTVFDRLQGKWLSDTNEILPNGKKRCGTAKPCNKYAPGFVYHYFNIEEGLAYENLRIMIYEACEMLVEIINNNDIVKLCTKKCTPSMLQ